MDTTSNHLTAPTSSSFMDATSNPTSSSSSPPSRWDAFLSFYGKDTRRNFIANLYFALDQAGILTFKDDPALEKGEQISPALLQAIKESKKFVVVLSENYAYSPWCLNELAEILISCKRRKNHAVIPVFYYVDPSDLRHQKGTFGKALDFHNKRYCVGMINKWRSALAEIAEISGYHLKKDANENESDTIQEIVENVAPQASTKVLQLEKYLFGIDSAVEEIYQKLCMDSNDVRAIGICGMGGIGKTTTAKAFFNKYSNKFDVSCFIENVKQYSQGGSPWLSLLEQLLIHLLRRKEYKVPDAETGERQLEQIFTSKKTLIILDDLDQSELLPRLCNLFSTGSRLIITTRDANLLNQLKVDISEVDIYMVKELGEIDSLELFSYHAFRKLIPPDSLKELSLKFVTYAGGLPLALKVLGSSLRGRTDVSFWKDKLERVRESPENKIQKILQLSYDELGDESEKAIFLDIVFFFVGNDKDEAVDVFKSCNFYPDIGIPTLEERCLLTIDSNNKFQMHNLIQDMGREVNREESKHGECKRLSLCQETLQQLEGIHKIEGLVLDLTAERHLCVKIFERMPNLRLLEITGGHSIRDVKGSFKNLFNNLRCIRWHSCPLAYLPSDFRPQKLVLLDMPHNKFKTMWKNTMPLTSLKIINVSYSNKLKKTSDFRDLKLVEKLLLRGCKNLVEVHPSVGQLTKLYHLDLGQCNNLKELPDPVGQLTTLGHLDLHYCVNLKRLPEQLGDLKCLKMLDASYTSIEQLPDSIADLKEVVELKLIDCKKLNKLPEHLGNMEGLRKLDASETSIEQLPDSFGRLINLVDLKLGWCKNLTRLPNSIWKLELLKVLDLRGCHELERLPEQLGEMQSLEMLNAESTGIEYLPDSIGLLSRLRELNVRGCRKLESLPNSLRNLTSLANLYVGEKGTVITNLAVINNLADTVKNMKKLEILHMGCNIRLWLPIILTFSSLKELALTDKGESFSLTKTFSLSTLSNLRVLIISNRTSLGSSLPELPLNLEHLWLRDYATLEQLPDLSRFRQLTKLYIQRCHSLQSLPPLPPHFRVLIVKDCTSLQHVPDLSTLKKLTSLTFNGCSNLESVSLKESSLQVPNLFYSFTAQLPNKEIPEWFSYKSSGCTISFKIPPDNFLGVALWLVYKFKTSVTNSPYIRAVIENKTEGITKTVSIYAPTSNTADVLSIVQCVKGDRMSVKSGDTIKVSFQTLLYSSRYHDVGVGKLKVKMCGAHVIQKTSSTPY